MNPLEQQVADAVADGRITTHDAAAVLTFRQYSAKDFTSPAAYRAWLRRWIAYAVGLADEPTTDAEFKKAAARTSATPTGSEESPMTSEIIKRRICWPHPDTTCLQGGCSYCDDYPYRSIAAIRRYAENVGVIPDRANGEQSAIDAFRWGLAHDFANRDVLREESHG